MAVWSEPISDGNIFKLICLQAVLRKPIPSKTFPKITQKLQNTIKHLIPIISIECLYCSNKRYIRILMAKWPSDPHLKKKPGVVAVFP